MERTFEMAYFCATLNQFWQLCFGFPSYSPAANFRLMTKKLDRFENRTEDCVLIAC